MSTPRKTSFTIGTRKSQLALVQAREVHDMLAAAYPHYTFPIVPMSTTGDQILSKPLFEIGEKALFTKELEVALKEGTVDLVVHSLKDLPTTLPEGLTIGAILKRENPGDAVVMKANSEVTSLAELPAGSVVGTSSIRRASQLRRAFPDLLFQDVRGNVNTRLTKLDDPAGPYAAVILAVAGLTRLGFHDRMTQILPSTVIFHAVGQGALAIECRTEDTLVIQIISALNDTNTRLMCVAERALMKTLEGGCSVPLGVCTELEGDEQGHRSVRLKGLVASLDGSKVVQTEFQRVVEGEEEAERLGKKVAARLIAMGASSILEELKANRSEKPGIESI